MSSQALHDDLPPALRRTLTVAVVGVHVGALWALMQVPQVRDTVASVAPLMVEFISVAPTPPKPAPPPPPRPLPKPAPTPPRIIAAAPTPTPAPAAMTVPEPTPAPPAPAVVAAPAPPAPAPEPAPPPAAPKVVPPSRLDYLVQPPIEVPAASRRLGESGRVIVTVVVDVRGYPKQVSLRRSSGFLRLDEQALSAMRQARFRPCTENGVAIECQSSAALEYILD